MKKIFLACVLILAPLSLWSFRYFNKSSYYELVQSGKIKLKSPYEACLFYPKTVQEIEERTQKVLKGVTEIVTQIIATPCSKQNKQTLIYALDSASMMYGIEVGAFSLIEKVHPHEEMRKASAHAMFILDNFYTDMVSMNVDLYKAFKTYREGNAVTEELRPEERYYLEDLIKNWRRSGLDLPEQDRLKVAGLIKKINKIDRDFVRNITEDARFIVGTKRELAGIDKDFIATLNIHDQGFYILRMDTPTGGMVMNYCTVQETRKRYSQAAKNKAYPKNVAVLDELIAARDELAKILGFESFADLDFDDQMIKTAQNAWAFLNDLEESVKEKAFQEFKLLTADLPEGVTLSPEGKLYTYDFGFVSTYFKKKHYDIDEREFAQYFSMEQTIDGLMSIYEQFFSLTIKRVEPASVWHQDVQLLQISDAQTGVILGYVFLDMFPRPHKYTGAMQSSAMRALTLSNGDRHPAVVTLVCNFTKPTLTNSSLLSYKEVKVFFHEFGHALHSIFGATRLASQSGTQVKTDFIELPSQMLENWLKDKDILKNLSCHYQTGKKMPDELIEKKLRELEWGLGGAVVNRLLLSMIALGCYGAGPWKDIDGLFKNHCQRLAPCMVYDEKNHFQCSFSYCPKMYRYLWADVLAQDVFAEIKKAGLLNPIMGKKYVDCILSKGGSKDPNELLVDFLGRQPTSDAFFKKMGL